MFSRERSDYQAFLLTIYRRFGATAWVSLGILVLAGVITSAFVMANQHWADLVYQYIETAMPKIEQGDSLFWIILKRNVTAAAIFISLGVVSLGLGTIAALIVNGALIGGLLAFSQIKGQIIWKLLVVGILPHGIIEIPAIALASGIGLNLARGLLTRAFGRHEISLRENLIWAIRCYLGVIIPGLVLAALIEANLTPYLINKFLV